MSQIFSPSEPKIRFDTEPMFRSPETFRRKLAKQTGELLYDNTRYYRFYRTYRNIPLKLLSRVSEHTQKMVKNESVGPLNTKLDYLGPRAC